MNDTQLLQSVAEIATMAGKSILEVYERSGAVAVSLKEDRSPLTEADRRAHDVIQSSLEQLLPALPILSEESRPADYGIRKNWQRYWLVDPLDGTREFVKRNGEFTVNIALIDQGRAVLGVVHVPVSGKTYSGSVASGARVTLGSGETSPIRAAKLGAKPEGLRVVASSSHRDAHLDSLLTFLGNEFGSVEEVSMGSSLKICLLAEGKADFYPRLGPTSEWDTAAAHAVLSAAGGDIVDTGFSALRYNQKEDLLNPFFLALADPTYDWQTLLKDRIK